MRKKLAIIFTVIFILLISTISSYAADTSINDIDINIMLDDDGTAHIKETWDIDITSGTEWYLAQGNLGDIAISDFSVSDETGKMYYNEGAWNIDRSLSQKAYKYGIVDKGEGGYELCWGIGSYGHHVFTATYTMSNFVKKYADYNGFNQRIVNDELSSSPEHIKVTIYKDGTDFTQSDTKVWAFGFKGKINVEDGKVVAESSDSLNYSNYVNIMVRFDPAMFSPTSLKTDQSFENLKNEAFKNSEYNSDSKKQNFDFSRYFPYIIIVFVFFTPFFRRLFKKRSFTLHTQLSKAELQNLTYCREIPFNGEISATYHMLNLIDETVPDGAIIGAYILRWMQSGTVRIEETEKKGILGIGDSTQPSIVFLDENTDNMEDAERELYRILKSASGFDNILQEKELYKWAKNNYETMNDWFASADFSGEQKLDMLHAQEFSKQPVFFGLGKVDKLVLTEAGKKMALDMLGFKKYLGDFTIINERKPAEVQLWKDYLVFATLFGIAEKVAQDFKDIYPQFFEQPEFYPNLNDRDIFTTMIWINSFSRAGFSGANEGQMAADTASMGGGGFSSFGGGGGFSGGGSGGGGR